MAPSLVIIDPTACDVGAGVDPVGGVPSLQNAEAGALHARLCQTILATGGWMCFSEFMQAALYDPDLGYYTSHWPIWGRDGDYFTAPQVTPLFAECLVETWLPIFETFESPSLIEIGAGDGQLMVDLLDVMASHQALPSSYYVVESSPHLRRHQQQYLEAKQPVGWERVRWCMPDQVRGVNGLMIANEVLDALPVTRFEMGKTQPYLIGVGLSAQQQLVDHRKPLEAAEADQHMYRLLQKYGPSWPAGFRSEYCPALPEFLRTADQMIDAGGLVWLDYGLLADDYYASSRHGGTLTCFSKHQAHEDCYAMPGGQDITAWVDFDFLARTGVNLGWQLAGYTTQAHFLLSLGLLEKAALKSPSLTHADQLSMSQNLQSLLLPGQMGEHIKAMVFTKNTSIEIPGFSERDFSDRLTHD